MTWLIYTYVNDSFTHVRRTLSHMWCASSYICIYHIHISTCDMGHSHMRARLMHTCVNDLFTCVNDLFTCVNDLFTCKWPIHMQMTYSHMRRASIYIYIFHIYICAPFHIPIHTSDVPQYIYIYISHICMCPFLCIHISYIYISTDDMAHSHMCERLIHTCANESFTHVACLVRIRIYDTNRLPGVVVLCDITYSCMWHASFTM